MSDFGRHWARKIRGCTIAEHAILHRLGDMHHSKTGLCFPLRDTLAFELECSPRYIVSVNASAEKKQFLLREKRFDAKGLQTSNQYVLNFERWFPFHSEEVERAEKEILAHFRHSVKDPDFAQGFHSVWLEKPYFPSKQKLGKNPFKRVGKSIRKKKLRRPLGIRLWIAIASKSHYDHVKRHEVQILNAIEKDTGHRYELEFLRIWLEK